MKKAADLILRPALPLALALMMLLSGCASSENTEATALVPAPSAAQSGAATETPDVEASPGATGETAESEAPEEAEGEGSASGAWASTVPEGTESAAEPAATPNRNATETEYEAEIFIYPDLKPAILKGTLRLTYVNKSADTLYAVKLHLYPNDIEPGSMSVSSVAQFDAQSYYELTGEDESILSVPLLSELAPGESTELLIRFSYYIPETGSRFGINDSGVMLGNFLPIACVYENGAWREDKYTSVGDAFYSDTANYTVSVTIEGDYKLAYTGSLRSKGVVDGDPTWYIEAYKVRDFALALLDGKKYDSCTISSGVGRAKVTAFAATEAKAETAAQIAASALGFFSDSIGDYPYDNLFVVPFDMEGGMEYPGLIMICEDYLSASRQSLAGMVIGHEAAHQWFYGVVGSDEIRAPWLDESLVEFLGIKFLAYWAGEDVADRMTESRYKSYASYTRTLPLSSDLYAFDPATSDYFYVVYAYGYTVYNELYNLMGETAFYEALSTYFNRSSYKIGTKDILIECFSAVYGRDLTSWFGNKLN